MYLQTHWTTLNKQLGKSWSGRNPIVLRHADELVQQYKNALATVQDSGEYDAILILFVPDARTNPEDIAHTVIEQHPGNKPMLTSFMGETSVLSSRELFANAHIPCFRTPEAATDAVDFLHRYLLSQQQLLQLPNPASRHTRADSQSAKELVVNELNNNARVLGPQKTRALLALFDIEVLPAQRAETLQDAFGLRAKNRLSDCHETGVTEYSL